MGCECADQPAEGFTLCPLGLQFFSPKPLKEFDLFEMSVDVGAGKKKKAMKCTGAVVRCQEQKEASRYKVWVQFLDLPKDTRDQIKCVAKDGKHLCSYCENF